MNSLTRRLHEWARPACAVAVGLLWAASFPKLSLAGMAWLVPGLMLGIALGCRPGEAFRLGYLAGLTFWLAALYWLLLIPVSFFPILGWLALSAFLALYPAAWVWLCWKLYPVGISRAEGTWLAQIDRFLSAGRVQRLIWPLTCAVLWVTWEMIQARLLSGFPWNLLGASQYRLTPVLQIAAFTGIYGVAFLMVWFSVSLLCALACLIRQPVQRESWMVGLMPAVLAVTAVVSYGMKQLMAPAPTGPELKLLLMQPSVPQQLIWNSGQDETRFRALLDLTERALTNQPDVVVWPESAVPGFARWDTNLFSAITNLVQHHGVWLILNANDLAPAARPQAEHEYDYFNSAFLVSPEGRFVADYRKRNLVIFGEYVPLADVLPFLKRLTPITGAFTEGVRVVPFVLSSLRVQTATLICFEDVFPHLVREYVEADTDFLLNLTNDGWFGNSAAQWQHAASAVLRAVENGRPLVRCANNGITCWIDAQGRLADVYYAGTQDVYGTGWKLVRIPIADRPPRPTLYTARGDWFGWSCVGLAALLAIGNWRLRRTLDNR